MIDHYCPDMRPDVAVIDDELAGYELTSILIRQGHRRIALLVGTETFATSVQDRLRGYRRALEEHGIAYDERWVGAEMDDVLGVSLDELDQLKKNYAVLAKIQMVLMQAVIDAHVQGVDYQLKISLTLIIHRLLMLDLMPSVALAWQWGKVLGEKAMELLVERMRKDAPAPPRIVRVPMRTMDICSGLRPPDFLIEEGYCFACFLHWDKPERGRIE